MVTAIESGVAEFGFVESEIASDRVVSTPVARDQLILVVGPDHPWACGANPTPAQLTQSEWVLREPGSGTRSVFEQALSEHGIAVAALNITLELPSNEAVRAAVEAGLGATVISASVAAPSIESGLLHHVRFDLPQRGFHVLRHSQRRHNRVVDAFLASLEKPRARPGPVMSATASGRLRTAT